MAQLATPATPFLILPDLDGAIYIFRRVGKSWECSGFLTGIPDAVETILSDNSSLVDKGDEGEIMLIAERSWNQH